MRKYTKKKIFLTYLKHFLVNLKSMFFVFPAFFILGFIVCLFENSKPEISKKLENKIDKIFIPMIDEFYDMEFKVMEIKHPDWFIKDVESEEDKK